MKDIGLARSLAGWNHAFALAGLLLGLLAALLSCPDAWAGTTTCTASSGFTNCVRITYSGGLQSWTVPAGVTSVQVKVWGAAGGGANSFYWGQQAKGGGGGYSTGYLAVTPGQVLSLVVGQGGQLNSTSATYGGGGSGGAADTSTHIGASGGGYSGIFASSTLTQANARIIAGGGGGTSPGADTFTQGTGGGGGTTGGQDSFPALSGRGGTQAAGGAAANGANECLNQPTAGNVLQGGTGANTNGSGEGGGGGGGGYFGGGGGLCQRVPVNNQNGGGGGGSGYLSASISSGSMSNGANATNVVGVDCTGTAASGGSSDTHYSSGIGQGSCFAAGGNGEIVIQYGMPTLTLVKSVTNDNGGAAAVTAWTLQAAGPVTISGTSGSAAVTAISVNAGTYALSESGGPSGYAPGSWSCTAGTLSGSNVTLAAGQNATCTINNNDTAPTLTLVKTVTNDNGGTSAVSAWTLQAAGPVTISGATGSSSVTNAAVSAGTYALSETGPSGYTAGSWACTAGTLSGSSLTLNLGQTATCTINNNDTAPRLTLVKTVTNDNGGTSAVSAWTLQAAGPVTISGATGSSSVTNAAVSAGTYALSESGPSGYTAGSWACTAGTLSGSNLTLSIGQTATCTINNNDTAPTLTLVKTISGDTTPSAVFSFTLTATGPVTISGVTGASAVTNAVVHAGTYALTESGPSGYTAGTWVCNAGTLSGSSLTLSLAQTATCTITNTRLPTVALQKITTGGFGGPFSFAGTNITGSFSNISTTAAGTAQPAAPTALLATLGTQATITETSSLAWLASGVSCSDANAANSGNTNPVATSSSGSVTISAAANRAGAIITCIFTNAAATPSLAMTKTPNVGSVNAAGQTVTYSIQVSNTGNTVLGPITVSDALGNVTCPSSGGATVTILTPGANETCSFSYAVPQAELDSNGGGDGDIDNSASASASYNGAPVGAGSSAAVSLVIAPNLTIDKSADLSGPVNSGDIITYTFRVKNTGNVTITNVGVNDVFGGLGAAPVPGSESLVADVAPANDSNDTASGHDGSWDLLAPGDEIEFTATYSVVQADIDAQ